MTKPHPRYQLAKRALTQHPRLTTWELAQVLRCDEAEAAKIITRFRGVGKRTPQPLGPNRATLDMIEDLEWMIATGETPAGAVRRLGRKQRSLERTLYRTGREDLARFVSAAGAAECIDCGALISAQSTRCKEHERLHRPRWGYAA